MRLVRRKNLAAMNASFYPKAMIQMKNILHLTVLGFIMIL
jgi:hypothetical protein